MEKANEEFKRILLDTYKKISHLKSHNQTREDHIRKLKNDEELHNRSDINVEEEIKCLHHLIMDKDNELVQVKES